MPRPAAAALLLALVGAASSCSFQDESLTRVEVAAPTAAKCGECHVAIFEEWQASKHATAFTNPSFREQTLDYQVETCLPCHIPESIFTRGGPVAARHFFRAEGVSCIACHLVEGEHHGPYFAGAVTPHPTKADPDFYFSASLCGTCHQGTYAAWSQARGGPAGSRTCQDCHMPAVRRKMTQATGLVSEVIVALHEEQDIRRHTFSTEIPRDVEVVAVAAEETAAPEGGGAAPAPAVRTIAVSVTNLLPHGVPTGDFGFRKAVLRAAVLDAAGTEVAAAQKELFRDLDTHLKTGATENLIIALPPREAPPPAARVRVLLSRVDRYGNIAFVIADRTVPVAPGPDRGESP